MQLEIYSSALTAPGEPRLPVVCEEWEARARAALDDDAYWYIAGAAGAGDTMRANREAIERRRIRPLVARDVSTRDISITLFGHDYVAPGGGLRDGRGRDGKPGAVHSSACRPLDA